LLADLVGAGDARADGPAEYLAEHGHPDLPPELVAEAVVSFADTASPEVAEQLAPFVTAHTAGGEHTADWFDLLTSAPAELADDPAVFDSDPDPATDLDFGPDPVASLDFGAGAFDVDPAVAVDEAVPSAWPATVEEVSPETATSEPSEPAEPETAAPVAADFDEPDEDSLD
jgi:hypothetical protein